MALGLSIVLPALGDVQGLETTLASVLRNRPENCEILVVHAGDYEDPYDLKGEVRFLTTSAASNPARRLNLGFFSCRAPIVHVIYPGVETSEAWCDAAISQFADSHVAAVAPLIVKAERPDRAISLGLEWRAGGSVCPGKVASTRASQETGSRVLAPSILAGFYRKSAIERLGVFLDSDLGLASADLELGLRLERAGLKTALAAESVLLASANLGPAVSPYERGFEAERLFWRYLPGNHANARVLAPHAWLWLKELAGCAVRPGGLAGLWGRFAGLRARKPTSSRGNAWSDTPPDLLPIGSASNDAGNSKSRSRKAA